MAGEKRQNAKTPGRKAAKANRLTSRRLGDRALINLGEPKYGGEFSFAVLADVAEVRSGFAFKSSDMGDFGIPIVKIKNITPPTVDVNDVERVPAHVIAAIPSAERYKLTRGDILIAMTGATVGKVGRFPKTEEVFYLNQRVGKVYLKNPRAADYDFIYYILTQPHYVEQIFGLADGSAQANISGAQIERLEIPLPPLPEQRAIAHILGTLDDKIELNRRISETLEAMARALFKAWFVDFEPVRAKCMGDLDGRPRRPRGRNVGARRASPLHPGATTHPSQWPQHILDLFPDRLVPSELGEIPEGWRVGTLGELADHPRRSIQPDSIKLGTPYIALEHMPKRCIALSDWGVADSLESNKFEFRKGEILFGKLRPYFHKVGVAPVNGVCSTDIVVVVPKSEVWFGFVLGHVSSIEFVEYTNAGSTGTKMPRTSWAEMARYKVKMPPHSVAHAFTQNLQPSVDRIIAGIRESRTLAALRDALLPKLISGEIRVRDAERFLKERGL